MWKRLLATGSLAFCSLVLVAAQSHRHAGSEVYHPGIAVDPSLLSQFRLAGDCACCDIEGGDYCEIETTFSESVCATVGNTPCPPELLNEMCGYAFAMGSRDDTCPGSSPLDSCEIDDGGHFCTTTQYYECRYHQTTGCACLLAGDAEVLVRYECVAGSAFCL